MSPPQTLPNLVSNLKALGVLLMLFVATFAGGFLLSDCKSKKEYSLLLGESNSTIEELSVERNRSRSLAQALSGKDEEAAELREVIRSYEERPAEIRYIVRTETIIEGTEQKTVELPGDHLFRFENGLPVSEFRQLEEGFLFKTFDIAFDATVVISEDETAVLLAGTSSYDDERYRLPVSTTEVTRIREAKLIEPHIMVGLTGSLNIGPEVTGDLLVSLTFPFIHPTEDLDILSPRISANSTALQFGVDVVSYNLGAKLPIVTDLWIGAGVGGDVVNGNFGIGVTLGSKF